MSVAERQESSNGIPTGAQEPVSTADRNPPSSPSPRNRDMNASTAVNSVVGGDFADGSAGAGQLDLEGRGLESEKQGGTKALPNNNGLTKGASTPPLKPGALDDQDPTAPRKNAPRRPIERTLRDADLHTKGKPFKGYPRQIAFAAPFPDSGVVLSEGPKGWRDWVPPGPIGFDSWQGWYLLLFHCIGATIISGGANFGIACAMYRSQSDITYWVLARNTVAGDMAVTVLIQEIVTFIITSSLVHSDLTTGPVAPLSKPWPPLLHLPSTASPKGFPFLGMRLPRSVPEGESLPMGPVASKHSNPFVRFVLWVIRAAYTGTERNDVLAPGISWRQRIERVVWSAAQGLLFAVIVFPWFWGIAMAITAPIYSAKNLGDSWTAPIIKLIYGGLLALLTNPVIALMAMGAESSVKRAYPELEIWQQEGNVLHADEIHA